MELLVRRGQKSGMLSSKITFTLDAKARLTEAEAEHVLKYKMSDTLLYQESEIVDPGSGLLGLASRAAFTALNTKVTVGTLMRGIHLECKDVVELLGVEERLVEASELFKQVLDAASTFGGEEVYTFDDVAAEA